MVEVLELGGLKKDRAKEMIQTYQELIEIQESNNNERERKKNKKAFEIACERELLGIDFKMNIQSLKQDLEEIKWSNKKRRGK